MALSRAALLSMQVSFSTISARFALIWIKGIETGRNRLVINRYPPHQFSLNVPKVSWREEIENAESEWRSPDAIHRCVAISLTGRTGSDSDQPLGEKPLKTLRMAQETRNALLADFKQLKRRTDSISKDRETWLKGGKPSLSVTFDQRPLHNTRHRRYTPPGGTAGQRLPAPRQALPSS
ncbi:MAG: hypothetical protein ACNA7Q_14985 [Rhodobacterales bacterium]